jgi:hypothetical protein
MPALSLVHSALWTYLLAQAHRRAGTALLLLDARSLVLHMPALSGAQRIVDMLVLMLKQ